MKKLLLFGIGMALIFSGCQDDEEEDQLSMLDQELINLLDQVGGQDGLATFTMPESDDFSAIPQDPQNPITTEKVALGQLLYHETGLAIAPFQSIAEGTYSCASCHFASAGFQAGRVQGIGEGGIGFGMNGEGRDASPAYLHEDLDVLPIRSPSAMNAAWQKVMLWNGQFGATGPNVGTEDSWTIGTPKENNFLGFEGIETQAIAGLSVHRLDFDTAWLEEVGYAPLFDAAFPDVDKSERYDRIRAGLAIAAYERTLLANKAPFQQWLEGDYDALAEIEKEGAVLFFGKAQCGTCHTGPALNSMTFYGYGMPDLDDNPNGVFNTGPDNPEHKGRGGFTLVPEDEYKFKTPQLYNMKDSPFLGHGGTFRSIREVVEYKNQAIPANPDVPASQLAANFQPLGLSASEVDAITAFLSEGLYDDDLQRYQPASVLSGLCFPNNDSQSQADLGCN